jgi:exostosin family protein
MARILLLSVDDDLPEYDQNKHFAIAALRSSAEIDRFKVHQVTKDPKEADVILFAAMGTCGDFAERVRAHPFYRTYPEKSFLFDTADHIRPIVPGVYASPRTKTYSSEHIRTGFYLSPENPMVQYRPLTGNEPNLAAFVGSSNTHPVREGFFRFNRPDIYVMDSSKESYRIRYSGTPDEKQQFWKQYADSIGDALFSLCPRGQGSGSIRLFESMKMGRGCIIVSDEWVPNEGVDFDSFSIRVPEAEVARIPELLDKLRPRAKEMGERARQQWMEWFAEDVRFHRVAELCLSMQSQRKLKGSLRRYYHLRHIAYPSNWRRYMISKKNMYRLHRRIFW